MSECKVCGRYHVSYGYKADPDECAALAELEKLYRSKAISYDKWIELTVDIALKYKSLW